MPKTPNSLPTPDCLTGKSRKFRTLVGQTGKDLMALRNAVPIEEYLAKMALNFA